MAIEFNQGKCTSTRSHTDIIDTARKPRSHQTKTTIKSELRSALTQPRTHAEEECIVEGTITFAARLLTLVNIILVLGHIRLTKSRRDNGWMKTCHETSLSTEVSIVLVLPFTMSSTCCCSSLGTQYSRSTISESCLAPCRTRCGPGQRAPASCSPSKRHSQSSS